LRDRLSTVSILEMEKLWASKRELRPRKRARLLQGQANSSASTSHPELSLLFDTVPKELFDNVLKFISRLPMAATWEKHICLHDIQKNDGLR